MRKQIKDIEERLLMRWHKLEPERCQMEEVGRVKKGHAFARYFYVLCRGQHRKATGIGGHDPGRLQEALQEACTGKGWDVETRSNQFDKAKQWECNIYAPADLQKRKRWQVYSEQPHIALLANYVLTLEGIAAKDKA